MSLKKSRAAFARPLVAAVLLLCLAAPVGAQDGWVYLFENDNAECYLNLRTVEDHDSYVIGWVRAVYSDADDSNAMSMVLYGAKKGSRQIRMFQIRAYDKDGSLIVSANSQLIELTGRGQWEYCTPDTGEELIWEALMDAAGIRY